MKCTKVILGGLIAGVAMVNAMPTLEQTKKVEPLVMDLMREDQNALKSGKKTRAEVAQSAMELADKAESEAAKLLLMTGAFNLYVRAGEFDKARETLQTIQTAIPDIPPQSVTNIITTAFYGQPNEKESLLYKLLDEAKAAVNPKRYCVIDLSAGPNAEKYPVTYMAKPPKGGFNTDEHKTTKLVLRRIEPGKFKMRGQYEVTLTKPFYCGVFEVTQKQYELVMGNNPSEFKGDMRPVESVSWGMIRGDSAKYNWPSSANVDSSSFIGKIRVRTGLKFDLPTEAQWEYACRAGTTSKFNNGGDSETDLKKLGRCNGNQSDGKGGNSSHHTTVGSYEPNRWGLYDMHGNVWEACLDWRGNLSSGVTDPQGPSSGAVRVARGGCWRSSMSHCVPSYQDGTMSPSDRYDCGIGFRVCIGAPLGDWNNATTTSPKLVKDAFALNAAPGNVTELNLGNVPPLQFVYCLAGKFSMGYKEPPALSKVKDVEITSPFWVSKTMISVDQLASLGLNSITNANIVGAAAIDDVSIVIQKLPSVLKERFGKMLPPGYVFRLPTEAEFEYLQKAETKDKNAQTNIWGVERLYSGGIIGVLDRAPAYNMDDIVNRRSRGTAWTDLVKVNYENQPDKDPVGWSDAPNWSVFRRGLDRSGCRKLTTTQRGGLIANNGFYFVVAPDVDKLNKFYWK